MRLVPILARLAVMGAASLVFSRAESREEVQKDLNDEPLLRRNLLQATSTIIPYAIHASSYRRRSQETNAVDGDRNTFWESKKRNKEWIYVDLGFVYPISQVNLYWGGGRGYGSTYKIQISNDAVNWDTKRYLRSRKGGLDEIKLPPRTSARYVRMEGVRRGVTSRGYALWEFEVEGISSGDLNKILIPIETSAPTLKPTSPPTTSPTMQPSMTPSAAPSDTPTSTMAPTAESKKFRLHWEEGFLWQGMEDEEFFCITYSGDDLFIDECANITTVWEFVSHPDMNIDGDQIKLSGTDQCMMSRSGRETSNRTTVRLQPCNRFKVKQRWVPGEPNGFAQTKFDIRPVRDNTTCLTQPHHPKAGERLHLESCFEAYNSQTGYWTKYN